MRSIHHAVVIIKIRKGETDKGFSLIQAGRRFLQSTIVKPCITQQESRTSFRRTTDKTASWKADRSPIMKETGKILASIMQAGKNVCKEKPDKRSLMIHQAGRIFVSKETDKRSSMIHQAGRISLRGKADKRS